MSENSIEFSLSNSEQRDSWLNSGHWTLDADNDCCEFIIPLNKITMFVLIIFVFQCTLYGSNKVCVNNDTCIDPIPGQSNKWTVSSFSLLQDTLRVNPTLGAYSTSGS